MSSNKNVFYVLIATIVFLTAVFSFVISEKLGRKKNAGPADDLRNGWFQFGMGEYNQAVIFFKKASKDAPKNSDDYFKARYGLACAYWLKLPASNSPRAKKIFKDIIKKKPDGDYAAWSMLALVRMAHIVPFGTAPDYPLLREEYLKISRKFPDHIAGHEAFIYMIETYLATLKKNDAEFAKTRLEDFLAKHADSPFLSSAWGLYSKACETLGLKNEMLAAEIKSLETLELDPADPYMDKSDRYWSISVIAEFEVGDFDTARKYYELLIKEYPGEKRNFAAKTAIERMNSIENDFRRELYE